MFRRGLFLALVGAVAVKAQQVKTAGPTAKIEVQPKSRSGYCPLDGTEGVYVQGLGFGRTMMRCPHCGTLFTETDNG